MTRSLERSPEPRVRKQKNISNHKKYLDLDMRQGKMTAVVGYWGMG